MRKILALIILLLLFLAVVAGAIMPGNWQTWQNYSIALFLDTPTPYIEIYHPDVLSFCEVTYKTAMLDQAGYGVYIEPYGYDVDETGKLIRDMSEWRLNKTTGLLELRI